MVNNNLTASAVETPILGPPDMGEYRVELKEAVAELIDQGFPVTVCNGKSPGDPAMGNGWQHQRLDADQAATIIDRVPFPTIGVMQGAAGGAVDFDIDGDEELDAFNELFDGDPPVLPTYTSGRQGGEHRLAAYDSRLNAIGKSFHTFKAPSGKRITVRLGCPKLDEKGELVQGASQSIVPPSYHALGSDKDEDQAKKGPLRWSGKRYAFKPGLSIDDIGLPMLPDSVVDKLVAAANPAPAKPIVQDLTDTAAPTDAVVAAMLRSTRNMQDGGDGSKRLVAVCCRLAEFNLRDGDAVAAVRAYELQRPFPRHYTDADILARLKYAYTRPDVQVGAALVQRQALTDMGNAVRFVQRYGDRVRYVAAWGKFLVWTGNRWTMNETGEVQRLAKQTARSIYAEASLVDDEEEAKKISKHAQSSQSRTRLDAMLALAESELPIPVRHNSLDADPWLLNCENGVLDLRTGELLRHDAGHLLTRTTGIEYPTDAGEDAVLWMGFLDQIFGGDTELIRFLQRMMGLALVGQQVEHVLPIFWGGGANGKSVFINTVQKAMGDYAMTAPPGLLMTKRSDGHPTENADLFRKRLVVLAETKDGQRLDEGLVKATTGGDRIRARRMREDFWEFTPSHTPVVVTNHRPMVQGDDFGIWRRLRLVPFTVTIPPDKQDRHLPEKLEAELPAILRWLVQGCLSWQRSGLQEPRCVRAATDDYRADCDNLARWLDEEAVATANAQTQSSVLLKRYRDWCDRNGETALSHRRFGERLSATFAKEKQSRGMCYIGIGIAAADPVQV
ncbi:hypothetical protein KOR34_24300 [Posidoniimonas corsicana]|uniref:SF3 helicase domain-containing protein n=1 Tax=Posidoniimonas corsicana TaxID=1938618 RepID=A0A5C5VFN7_9BACT|nr:phage/plasmid primase, P4 family [Posidoniimonas corsicana]TWT37478.1 hypothetical protein KOR34_24300 [Posidoniimonas corsicana]